MKETVEYERNVRDKMKEVNKSTFQEFLRLRSLHQIVKDSDLKKIAIVKAREIGLDEATSSKLLLLGFIDLRNIIQLLPKKLQHM